MLRVLPFLLILAVTLFAFIDCLETPDQQVRSLPRRAWLVIIVLFTVIGAMAWFIKGRPIGGTPAGRTATGGTAAGPLGARSNTSRGTTRTLAPDDDPDFLRQISRTIKEQPRQPDPPDEPDAP